MDPLGGSAPGIGQIGGGSPGFLAPGNPAVTTVSNDSVITSVGITGSAGSSAAPSAPSPLGTVTTASSSPMPSPIQHQTAFIMNTPSVTPPPPPVHSSPSPSSQGVPMEVDQTVPHPGQPISNGVNSNSTSTGTPPPPSPSTASPMTAAAASAELVSKMNGTGGAQMSEAEKTALMVVLSYLKKHEFKDTAETLLKEAKIADAEIIKGPLPLDSDVQTVLSSYASDENPDEYTDAYNQLRHFIDTSLDAYKYEVGQVLWPVFVHMYLELIYNEHETQAAGFFGRFSKMQETFHEIDMTALGSIKKKQQLINSENPFRSLTSGLYSGPSATAPSGLYVVRMSREAQSLLKRFLQEKRLKLVQNIVQDRIHIEVYDGIPRGKAAINAVTGHLMGEALKQDNKAKVYYGLLREPDLNNVQMDEDDEDGSTATIVNTGSGSSSSNNPAGGGAASTGGAGTASGEASTNKGAPESGSNSSSSQAGASGSKPDAQASKDAGAGGTPAGGEKSGSSSSKKKKSKKDWLLSKKGKNDPNAPPLTRMPLPELRDVDKIEKAKALRESAKRVTLGPEKLPSCCFYTILNGDNQVTYVKWSEDGTLMAIGFASSLIKVWTLTNTKLRKLKPASELVEIEREADDVLVRMMDDSHESQRCLRGHSGPVYSLDFSPDKMALLSSSEDCSIRLWSLLTWTCIVVYKGHLFPVWKAVFSPHGGYYFASAGYDCTARLWATDSYSALRVFAGHYADVTAVIFHPNSNYVATGSADRSVRLWDCVSGACVRLMTGHKGKVHALAFSMDGRFLVSSANDAKVLIWDMANGGLLTSLNLHKSTVYSITFSREGNVLATGGLDYCVRLWDFMKMIEDVVTEDGGGAVIPPDVKRISGDSMLIGEYYTKATPIYSLHFTRRNILVATGPFN